MIAVPSVSVLEALQDDELAVAIVAAGLPEEITPQALGFEDLMGLVVEGINAIGFKEVRSRALRSMLAHLDGSTVMVDAVIRSVWGSAGDRYTAGELVRKLRTLAAEAVATPPVATVRKRHLWAVAS
jgi:hypothetical protein